MIHVAAASRRSSIYLEPILAGQRESTTPLLLEAI